MKSKRIALSLCVLLLVGILSPMAMALDPDIPADDPIEPDPYTYISFIAINFEISSAGLTDDYCRVYIPDTSCSCWLDMFLERWNTNASTWETVKSWSKYGVETITLEKEWYVASGYTYRLECSVEVYDSNMMLGESVAAYSVLIPFGTSYP